MPAGCLELPTGYDLKRDPDILILRSSDGTEVAAFSADGATAESIRRTAEEAVYGVQPGTHLHARFFGNFEVFLDGEALTLGATAKATAILKYLLAHGDRPVSRDHLMGWLWPEASPKRASWSLNTAVRILRKTLSGGFSRASSPGFIVLEEAGYRLCSGLRVSTDVTEFDDRYERGRRLEREGRISEASTEYEKAAELYRADYLVEDLYEDWTMVERERLVNAYVNAVSRLAGFYLESGRYQESIAACYKLLDTEPCHEGVYRTLIECCVRLGSPTLALRQYRLCEEMLERKHGLGLSAETKALYHHISRKAISGGIDPSP